MKAYLTLVILFMVHRDVLCSDLMEVCNLEVYLVEALVSNPRWKSDCIKVGQDHFWCSKRVEVRLKRMRSMACGRNKPRNGSFVGRPNLYEFKSYRVGQ